MYNCYTSTSSLLLLTVTYISSGSDCPVEGNFAAQKKPDTAILWSDASANIRPLLPLLLLLQTLLHISHLDKRWQKTSLTVEKNNDVRQEITLPRTERGSVGTHPVHSPEERADLQPPHPQTQNETEAIGGLFSPHFFFRLPFSK